MLLLPSKSASGQADSRLSRRSVNEAGIPIPIKKPYDSSAKKRVVSRRKNSVLQKNAKNCKKMRAFAHLLKPSQNHAKISSFQRSCAKKRTFQAIPRQITHNQKTRLPLPSTLHHLHFPSPHFYIKLSRRRRLHNYKLRTGACPPKEETTN